MIFLLAAATSCSAVTLTNVDGTWSSAGPGAPTCLAYDNSPADPTNENIVAYGRSTWYCPSPRPDFSVQSGFGFDGAAAQEVLPGAIINLGTFRHHNRPISAPEILTYVSLGITLYISGVSPSPTFTYVMNLDETDNGLSCSCAGSGSYWCCKYGPCSPSNNPCPDRVWWQNTQSSTTFTLEGKSYTLQILGFADCSNPNSAIASFITQENRDNYACLFGRLSGNTPSIHVEKYTNGVDVESAADPNRPTISSGCPVTWTYKVTNDGNVVLGSVAVVDSMGVTPVRVDINNDGYNDGDLNKNGMLDLTEVWTYTATGTAISCTPPACECDYSNTATATAIGGTTSVSDTDSSYYHAIQTRVDAGPDQTICSDPVIVSLAGSSSCAPVGKVTYLWTAPNGHGTFSNPTGLSTTYTASQQDIASGSVEIRLTATGTCSGVAAEDSMILTIIEKPEATIRIISA